LRVAPPEEINAERLQLTALITARDMEAEGRDNTARAKTITGFKERMNHAANDAIKKTAEKSLKRSKLLPSSMACWKSRWICAAPDRERHGINI